MKDPRRQFVPLQRRLSEHDALHPHTRPAPARCSPCRDTPCCTLNDRVLSPSHPLLRPRLPLGLVGLSCHRRCQVALWRPARMARRDDRPDRERLRLRAARLHARRPGARVPHVPRARDAVRHRAARARPRHVADVPRRRRHTPPRPRARVRGLPRAAARAVHDHALPRGPEAAARGDQLGPRHRRRRDHRRRQRPRDGSAVHRRPRPGPQRRQLARPSSRTSTPTPTAACATRRRASASPTARA